VIPVKVKWFVKTPGTLKFFTLISGKSQHWYFSVQKPPLLL
jgi:hypothetical protein